MDEDKTDKYEEIRRQADALYDAMMRHEDKTSPLRGLLNEAQDIISAYDHKTLLAAKLEELNSKSDLTAFNDLIGRLGDMTQDSVYDVTTDLDARLIKQARTLDTMHDLLLHMSQYALAQDTGSLQIYVNMLLKTQDQSARTIERFKRLGHRNHVKIDKQTEQHNERTEQNATLDR